MTLDMLRFLYIAIMPVKPKFHWVCLVGDCVTISLLLSPVSETYTIACRPTSSLAQGSAGK